jgi:hypothetical protein
MTDFEYEEEEASETGFYPQCEKCYIGENSIWEPDSVGEDGSLVAKLTSVSVPLKLEVGSINVCCTCGDVTIVGIYAEKNVDDVEFDEDPIGTYEITETDPDDYQS